MAPGRGSLGEVLPRLKDLFAEPGGPRRRGPDLAGGLGGDFTFGVRATRPGPR